MSELHASKYQCRMILDCIGLALLCHFGAGSPLNRGSIFEQEQLKQAAELGFTESHQLAVDVSEFGGGDEVARHLKDNNIILNMNLLPFESLDQVSNPAGIRLGVQEMTRFGMKEAEE